MTSCASIFPASPHSSGKEIRPLFGYYISTRDVRALLLDTIKTVSAYAISNEAKFIEKVRSASEVRQTRATKDLQRKLNRDLRRSKELDAFNADTSRVDQFLALAKKYTDFSVLTTPMIYEFVDKALVHAPDKSTGDRTQEVDIH